MREVQLPPRRRHTTFRRTPNGWFVETKKGMPSFVCGFVATQQLPIATAGRARRREAFTEELLLSLFEVKQIKRSLTSVPGHRPDSGLCEQLSSSRDQGREGKKGWREQATDCAFFFTAAAAVRENASFLSHSEREAAEYFGSNRVSSNEREGHLILSLLLLLLSHLSM